MSAILPANLLMVIALSERVHLSLQSISIRSMHVPVSAGKSAQQPWASPGNPGCSHEVIPVTAGKTYRLRIINAGSLAYQTVCFEGHNVTIIAADATPTEPVSFGSCVDVNSGQRYCKLCDSRYALICMCSVVRGAAWHDIHSDNRICLGSRGCMPCASQDAFV